MKNIIEFICVYKPKQSWEQIKTTEVKFCVNYCCTLRDQNYQEENVYQIKNQQPAQPTTAKQVANQIKKRSFRVKTKITEKSFIERRKTLKFHLKFYPYE